MAIGKMYFRKSLKCWYTNETTESGVKQHRLSPDENDARRMYRTLALERGSGVQNPTASDVAAIYLAWVEKHRGKQTYRKVKSILESGQIGFLQAYGSKLAADINPIDIDNWINDKFPNASDTTKHDRMGRISSIWNFAETKGLIVKSKIRRLIRPKPTSREHFLPKSEWSKLLDACPNDNIRSLLEFMFMTGARPQEAVKLKVSHWQGKRFSLKASQAKGKRDARHIGLPPSYIPTMQKQLEGKSENDFVFVNTKGKPWSKDSINCAIQRLKKEIGDDEFVAYTCRHSFCANAVSVGVPLADLAPMMGHRSTAMIEKVYGHLLQQTERHDKALAML